MWRNLWLAVLLGAVVFSSGATKQNGAVHPRRLALVIGNANYGDHSLANAARDAAATSKMLTQLGFEVMTYSNLDRARMNEAVQEFNKRLAAGGVGLVYFAGHAIQVGKSTLLLPVDAQRSPVAPITQGIDLNSILAGMSASRSDQLNLIVLDTCLNNPYDPANVSIVRPPSRTIVAYAAAPGAYAADGTRHGTYTAALLRAINQPGRNIEDVLHDVARSVSLATAGQQVPWMTEGPAAAADRFQFAPSTLPASHSYNRRSTMAAETVVQFQSRGILPKDSSEEYELTFWESIKDSTYPSDYEAYLKAYPNGRFATLAHARIDRLRAAASATKAQPPAQADHARAVTPPPPPVTPAPSPAGKAAAASTPPTPAPTPAIKTVATAAGEIKDCATCPALVSLPGGTFEMGSNSDDPAERPVHRVSIGRPFAIGKYEVTIEQWNACADATGCPRIDMEGNVSKSAPVRNLSWDDAQVYVKWLSKTTGKTYRLPTEAEWEYAARGGTTTTYWWGNEMRKGYADCKDCGEPWRKDSPVNVGSFLPNPFGLFDMNGSVWEWVGDCWHSSYKGAPADGRVWDEPGCPMRVIRGGSWPDGAAYMQSSTRFKYSASVRQSQNGMRVARDMK
ncbi:Hercynine oxygenase (plasmid) [Caballeronia sp. SBC1]|uniref:SUMF1/EgtB/PvdO family nonheme iron enzyme n=2 Tax=unclassified Caballeronia TaxID=2646786 RepID=UPI0013E15A10|nr:MULTISPECIES: SUMF1/EgtB/PvdO family nonheme iron enzyme [unclassified Caballeronia]QIE26289.1 Hercynine oxygenase [Caballeronia sp. SBC2]QIN64398.1 Hercynine oxygenase [Caballeronia sp. SBC1]